MDTLFNYQSLEIQNTQPKGIDHERLFPSDLRPYSNELISWYKSEKIWNCDVPRIKKSWFGGLKKLAARIKLLAVKKALRKQNLQYFQ